MDDYNIGMFIWWHIEPSSTTVGNGLMVKNMCL